MTRRIEYEIIDGKPHLGEWFGSCIILNSPWNDESIQRCQQRLESSSTLTTEGLERRHKNFIVRPPLDSSFFAMNGTISIKYLAWGRAFKVKKLLRKGIKSSKTVWLNGKRRRVYHD